MAADPAKKLASNAGEAGITDRDASARPGPTFAATLLSRSCPGALNEGVALNGAFTVPENPIAATIAS